MVQDYYTLLTPAGLEAVTFAIATETSVDFAYIAVGDANGTTYFPTGQERTLKNEVWRGPITSYEVKPENPNWLQLEASIPGSVGGFTIREAGLFGSNNVLLAIAKPPEAYKPQLNQGAAMDLRVRMTLEVTNADRVIINIDPSIVYASKQYVDDQLTKHLDDNVRHVTSEERSTWNNHIPNPVLHTHHSTASGSNNKTITLSPAPTSYVDFMAVVFKNTTANTGAVTLNVNGLGDKNLVKSNGKALTAGDLAVNGIYTARYNASTGNFILQGEGGGVESNKIMAVEDFLETLSSSITAIGVEPSGNFIWVGFADNTLKKYNIETFAEVYSTTISYGLNTIHFDNAYLYCCRLGEGYCNVTRINLSTMEVTTAINGYPYTGHLFHTDNEYLYLATSGTNEIQKISKATLSKVAFVNPDSTLPTNNIKGSTLDNGFLYVFYSNSSCPNLTNIRKINVSTMQVVATSPAISLFPTYWYNYTMTCDSQYVYLMDSQNQSIVRQFLKTTLALQASGSVGGRAIVNNNDKIYVLRREILTTSNVNEADRLIQLNASNLTDYVKSVKIYNVVSAQAASLTFKDDDVYLGISKVTKFLIT